MRILFLTNDLPYPPYGGAPLRNYGLIEGLAQDHAVWLMAFQSHERVDPAHTPLADLCQDVITAPPPEHSKRDRLRTLLLSSEADMARRCQSDAFAARLRDLLASQPFDVVQLENLEITVYLPLIRQMQPDARIIYDAHNAEYALQRHIYETDRRNPARWHAAAYSLIQWRRIRAFEREVCAQADYVVAVSDADAALLEQLNTGTPIMVVPNGIFARAYDKPANKPVSLDHPALVFTGKMDYRPNVDAVLWFAQEILPQIRRKLPRAHFYIVGQSPHARLGVLRGQAGVTLTGFVPSVLPYLQAADVFVVPLRMGSGTRLKVLEAMASARPIVSTTIGAEGLNAVAGEEIILADSATDFATTVVKLQKNPAFASALGANARLFALKHYDWSVLIPRLLRVYEALGVL